jgi:23S rRNA (cytidine1920-2'-O)/16S rRNA (cytidine1409-2'-O)-methyltransferase
LPESEPTSPPFVSRAGWKLEHALDSFRVDVTGFTCADFGCNVGGFTDCMLQRGAACVYAIDTGYGTLAYTLRCDERVIVMERTNALHARPPGANGRCDLVTIDLAWTPQRLAIPAALRWLKADGRIITLIKPHYELVDDEKDALLVDGRLDHDEAHRITQRVLEQMPALGATVLDQAQSPLTGGKSSRRKRKPGNIEFTALLRAIE